jgi:hypothetical protein
VFPLESSAAQDADREGESGRNASKLCKSSFDREVCNFGKAITSLDANLEYRSYDDRISRRLVLHGFGCLKISSFQMFHVEGSFCQNKDKTFVRDHYLKDLELKDRHWYLPRLDDVEDCQAVIRRPGS